MVEDSSSPFSFSFPDGDIILRSADGVDFRVHTALLSLASPFFRDMFNLPQTSKEVQTIEMTEKADVLEVIFQFIYPLDEPSPYAAELVLDIYKAADKLQITKVQRIAQRRLCAWLEEDVNNPLEAWAIAVQLDIPEAIISAKRRFISADTATCLEDFPDSLTTVPVEEYATLIQSKELAIQKAWDGFAEIFTCQSELGSLANNGRPDIACFNCAGFMGSYHSMIWGAEIFDPKASDFELLSDCHGGDCASSSGGVLFRASWSLEDMQIRFRAQLSAILSEIS